MQIISPGPHASNSEGGTNKVPWTGAFTLCRQFTVPNLHTLLDVDNHFIYIYIEGLSSNLIALVSYQSYFNRD